VRIDVSPEAEAVVRGLGGRLWVWAARPWGCCWGTPAYMNAATTPPARIAPSAFSPVDPLDTNGLEIWFRAPGGREPDVLEISMKGKRHPRVEAYWDGCSYML
jgi:hypothetical protein